MYFFANIWGYFFLMVFDFTQFWLDGRPGNDHFWISHKISDHLTPLTSLDLRPQWFETDWCNSSPSAMRDQYFCFLAKFGCTRINLALSTDQNIVLCCDLLTDDKFWEDFFGIWISYLNSTLVGRCTFLRFSKQLVCTSKCFSFDLQFLPTS